MCVQFSSVFFARFGQINRSWIFRKYIYLCELVDFFVSASAFKNPFISVICAQSIPRFICQIPAITFTEPSISHCDFILALLPCVCQFVLLHFFLGLRLSISFNLFVHTLSPSTNTRIHVHCTLCTDSFCDVLCLNVDDK